MTKENCDMRDIVICKSKTTSVQARQAVRVPGG